MIRAAAKNHDHVAVVVDPADYEHLLQQLGTGAQEAEEQALRRRLAWKAFQHCAAYDSAVSEWLWQQIGEQPAPARRVHVPWQDVLSSSALSCVRLCKDFCIFVGANVAKCMAHATGQC